MFLEMSAVSWELSSTAKWHSLNKLWNMSLLFYVIASYKNGEIKISQTMWKIFQSKDNWVLYTADWKHSVLSLNFAKGQTPFLQLW